MRHLKILAQDWASGYNSALRELYENGEFSSVPDWNTTQKEIAITIEVKKADQEPLISLLSYATPESLQEYTMEMLDGIKDFEVDEGKWAYTYHRRMVSYPTLNPLLTFDQIKFVIDELSRNLYSRRAVITVRDPFNDAKSDDPACLQMIQFLVRSDDSGNDALNMFVTFRSNDACKAAFMNGFALIFLQKRLADQLGVSVGEMIYTANSFHCYQRDFELLDGYINRMKEAKNPYSTKVIAYYERPKHLLITDQDEDWKTLMDEEKDKILKKVEALKSVFDEKPVL